MTVHESAPLLRVRDLSVSYGRTQVVSGVGFDLARGQSLALIGESGSGKSTIARAVLRLLPRDTGKATGTVEFEGQDTLALSLGAFRSLRGRRLGFVPQDPASSLNAVRTIGAQAHEAAALMGEKDAGRRRARILEAFERVGLPDPVRVYRSYPHQLSGGMLQRVLIGLAVLPEPSLLVADEPTSALDVTIQKRILDLLTELRTSLGIGLLLITHDLALAAERADSLLVLRDGVVQEAGPTAEVFRSPRSEYAAALRDDVPALNPDRYRAALRARTIDPARPQVSVAGAVKEFTVDGSVLRAVDDVSFRVPAGSTHALVGESGSGKTTAVRLLLGLEQPDAGEITVGGEDIHGRSRGDLRAARRHLQLVYQNPFTSLDPTWRVERLVREPLDRYRVGDRHSRRETVRETLAAVGLKDTLWDRHPAALSGGQRQRVAIARAIALRPDVVVLDEPTSALDVSVQAEILDVLVRLQVERGLTYLFVSHDLALVRQVADTVTVLQRGRVVEDGTAEQVLDAPRHPYTRALVDAIPDPRLDGTSVSAKSLALQSS
ncbi:ABC transporter ATP-binding protein [Microbacterium sp. SORGH_AS_0888]|uniref:dipeptide ABC transporter ATP-binding protein n=1 Tax=Microbacterium sp. SORGH_AS_0888 TaxID=3041791 RepID=UPI0027890992|nr:ABC transporter ATP-binding protein [Microbacterium sp. SORGH_AS_0888]MDQ1130541.1 peptide/nickel transport system ATP-binding protein [Microbacterium sp. SORGH_AS_0888]